MDGNGGNIMRKLNGGWIRTGIMIWKSENGWKGGIMMCKLKGRMDKGGHYDV